MKRWLIDNSISVLIYASFAVSLTFYLRGVIKYNDVESWPSVPAEIVDRGGQVISSPRYTQFGSTTTTIDTRFVEFQYSVAGKNFSGTKATPDGGGLPINIGGRSFMAHYDPNSPDIAVLLPVSFRGTGLLVTAVFSGIMVAVHFCFTVVPLLARRRGADQTGKGKHDTISSRLTSPIRKFIGMNRRHG